MKLKMFFIYSLILINNQCRISAQIRIVLSSALTEAHYEFRKNQYITSFSKLIKYGYPEFYVVEACAKNGPTFLDAYSKNVFYATCNDANCYNQGVNESRTILEALKYFNFDPEDMIIKLTGRHCLLSDYFIKLVEANLDHDAFVKICNDLMPCWADGMVPTMCFAMKNKYLQELYESIDYAKMKQQSIAIEWLVADFLNKKSHNGDFKIFIVDRLDIEVNAFASSASPGQPEKIFIF